MNIRISNEGEQMVVFLKGELNYHTVSQIRIQIDASIENTRPSLLIFDFSDVGFMDSSGIGAYIGTCEADEQLWWEGRYKIPMKRLNV